MSKHSPRDHSASPQFARPFLAPALRKVQKRVVRLVMKQVTQKLKADEVLRQPRRDRKGRTELEAKLEDRNVKWARDYLGLISRKLNGLGYRAWPDREFLPPATVKDTLLRLPALWVEFKRWGEVPTPEQERLHKDLRARGQWVAVVDNDYDFRKVAQAYVAYCRKR